MDPGKQVQYIYVICTYNISLEVANTCKHRKVLRCKEDSNVNKTLEMGQSWSVGLGWDRS